MHGDNAPSINSIAGQLAHRNLNWLRMRDRIAAARSSEQPETDAEALMGPFVTIARPHGAGGAELAQRIGANLGWPVLDHAIVDMVAERLNVDPNVLNTLDKGAASWVSDVLAEVMPTVMVTRDTYTRGLRRVLQLLAMHGDVVFLGRAANLFLPPARGLSVFVVATLEHRIARIRERTGLDEARARVEIEVTDKAREQFVARTFARDWSDPALYDLVVNTSRASIDELADLVVATCRRRLKLPSAPTAPEPVRRTATG